MDSSRTWWRKLGTALAALVLAVLVFGPGLDGIVCQEDAMPSAAAADVQIAPSSLEGQGPASDKMPGVCFHGHCHHSSPFLSGGAAVTVASNLSGKPQRPARSNLVLSDRQFELIRPPRA
jgi:hypothetical protein